MPDGFSLSSTSCSSPIVDEVECVGFCALSSAASGSEKDLT